MQNDATTPPADATTPPAELTVQPSSSAWKSRLLRLVIGTAVGGALGFALYAIVGCSSGCAVRATKCESEEDSSKRSEPVCKWEGSPDSGFR